MAFHTSSSRYDFLSILYTSPEQVIFQSYDCIYFCFKILLSLPPLYRKLCDVLFLIHIGVDARFIIFSQLRYVLGIMIYQIDGQMLGKMGKFTVFVWNFYRLFIFIDDFLSPRHIIWEMMTRWAFRFYILLASLNTFIAQPFYISAHISFSSYFTGYDDAYASIIIYTFIYIFCWQLPLAFCNWPPLCLLSVSLLSKAAYHSREFSFLIDVIGLSD